MKIWVLGERAFEGIFGDSIGEMDWSTGGEKCRTSAEICLPSSSKVAGANLYGTVEPAAR